MITLSQLCVHYEQLVPCYNAFVDSRSPGSDRKENFTIIGPGVSENPDQYVHIPKAHGFNIGGARQPPGCLNSQHSHLTAEVFIVHTGNWRFKWGVNGDDGAVDIGPGDTISLPTNMFRGFENIGREKGFMFAVLGGDDPGKVTWAPAVFDLAKNHGLVLLKGGRLIDTKAGEEVPADAEQEQPPNEEEIARLASPQKEDMLKTVVRYDALQANENSPLAAGGVEECAIITPTGTADGFSSGPIVGWWEHGFNLRCVKMGAGKTLPSHSRVEEEVILMQEGGLHIQLGDDEIEIGPGAILTLPKNEPRRWQAMNDGAVAFVVRGGDSPRPIIFDL